MKTVFLICCVTFFFFVATNGQRHQKVAEAISNVLLPCATESGLKASDLDAIQNGDLSSITNLFGCFSDCAAEKVGIVSGDAFQVDPFQTKLSEFIGADRVKELMDQCGGKAGNEKCKVSGPVFQCFLGVVLSYIYS